ncbi:MAG: hypothetical protein P4N59_13110 [Negativicutes bacterium]|nr:hypothetical protein [Negativicutes bacterium]
MFHFLPDHPVHTKINGTNANVRQAQANAEATTNTGIVHQPAHSFRDASGELLDDDFMKGAQSLPGG